MSNVKLKSDVGRIDTRMMTILLSVTSRAGLGALVTPPLNPDIVAIATRANRVHRVTNDHGAMNVVSTGIAVEMGNQSYHATVPRLTR